MALYMNYNDLKIKGDVTAKGFENWINIGTLNYSVGRGVSMGVGSMKNREIDLPALSEIMITKGFDSSTPLLLKESLAGQDGVKIEIALVRTGSGVPEEVGRIILEDALISHYGFSADSSSPPAEQLSISYSKITADLKGADKANKNGQAIKVGFDLSEGKAL